MGMQNGVASVENSLAVPPKINIKLPYDPVILLLPKIIENMYSSKHLRGIIDIGDLEGWGLKWRGVRDEKLCNVYNVCILFG